MIKSPSAKKTYRSQHGTFNFYLFYLGSIIIPIYFAIHIELRIYTPTFNKTIFYAKLHWQNMFNRFEVREIWQKIQYLDMLMYITLRPFLLPSTCLLLPRNTTPHVQLNKSE
jgi:hypothetical protein